MKNIHLNKILWYNDLNEHSHYVSEQAWYHYLAVYGLPEESTYKGVTMELKVDNGEGIDSWREVTLTYSAALKQLETKMEILNDEFQHVHQYNPIEHIKARIKTPESIVKKLKRHGYESTIDNMVKYINDIAGIRIICSFTSDIFRMTKSCTLVCVRSRIRCDLPSECGFPGISTTHSGCCS